MFGYQRLCADAVQEDIHDQMNIFFGKIIDRSYMGGEVSYFVKIESQQVLHVINLVDRDPLRIGNEVFIKADPEYCRLLKA